MNERIKNLIADCTWVQFAEGVGHKEVFDKEKFAEMIVRECSTVVASVSPCFGDYRDQIEVNLRDYCAKKIMEHFGVEE